MYRNFRFLCGKLFTWHHLFLRTAFEDVTTPFEPFIGKMDKYDCTTEGPDGFIDLTLKFDIREVIQTIGRCQMEILWF
jgi:hypothetical protein